MSVSSFVYAINKNLKVYNKIKKISIRKKFSVIKITKCSKTKDFKGEKLSQTKES